VTGDRIPFIDLRPGEDDAAVRAAIDRVITRGWFVLGPEVEAFEAEFASAGGAAHAVGVGTGTDAIALMLRAMNVNRGDEVIVPALTAAYTALAVLLAGATPVFADIDPERLTLDPAACEAAVTSRTVAIIPVHLYGQAADMRALQSIAQRRSLAVIEDCCQAHLATCDDVPVGTQGAGGAFSFYPTKNLGALGDGGAILTNDASLAQRLRRLRNGGQVDRYVHLEAGANSRLDDLQAAVLRARLPFLSGWTSRRRSLADAYRRALPDTVRPLREHDSGHVYHLFVVRSPDRDALQAHMRASGVDTLIHYPVPLPSQPAFAGIARGDCTVAAHIAGEILSLPLHPRLTDADVARVSEAIGAFQKGRILA
jgi:dTDP-3-amino-3,4,6-trideoxy-alpha-D-glucose transaminase